jgi:hypothetical protein
MAVRRVGVSCETVTSRMDMNMKTEEATTLEAITR